MSDSLGPDSSSAPSGKMLATLKFEEGVRLVQFYGQEVDTEIAAYTTFKAHAAKSNRLAVVFVALGAAMAVPAAVLKHPVVAGGAVVIGLAAAGNKRLDGLGNQEKAENHLRWSKTASDMAAGGTHVLEVLGVQPVNSQTLCKLG